MFLGGDDRPRLGRAVQDKLSVNRLNGRHVDNARADALGGKLLACLNGLLDHQSVGDNRHVCAFAEHHALADFEFVIAVENHRHRQSAEAQIAGAVHLSNGSGGQSCFGVVGRNDDRHVRNGAHEGNVLTALMARAVLTDRNAAVGRADFDIELGVRNGIADLLKGSARSEHREGAGKYDIAAGRHTGRNAHHVLLGDAAVKEFLGVRLFDLGGLGRARQIRVKHIQVRNLARQFDERIGITLAGCNFFNVCHIFSLPIIQPVRKARRIAP